MDGSVGFVVDWWVVLGVVVCPIVTRVRKKLGYLSKLAKR
jgi:hypothetical protein